MADDQRSPKTSKRYRYRLYRYRPTNSGEFYNIAVVLEDAGGAVIDARFAPDFDRLSCNPAADLDLLEHIRDEFEESRLLGEAFSEHLRGLTASRYPLFEEGSPEAFLGGEAPGEIDRLVRSYLATPAAPQRPPGVGPVGGRQAIRRRISEVFERQGLIANGPLPWLCFPCELTRGFCADGIRVARHPRRHRRGGFSRRGASA